MSLSGNTVEVIDGAGLEAAAVESIARAVIAEDLAGQVDVTTAATVPADHRSTADFVARSPGVIAGIAVAMAVMDVAGAVESEPKIGDGSRVEPGDVVLTVRGASRDILTGERSALNLLSRLSGVATSTARWVDAVAGTAAVIRDTRKTTPGLRFLEKYAVRAGGGRNHRLGLGDQALIKDNHVIVAGGITAALTAVRTLNPGIVCEVECDTTEQVAEAVAAGAELILLDNMSLADTRESVRIAAGKAKTESSGGLTLDRAREVAETGVDFISVGALTHSAPALDIGLDVRPG